MKKYKLVKNFVIIAIILSLLISVVACSARVDEDRNLVKPSLEKALENYQKLTKKNSEFNGKIIMKLYGTGTNVHTIGQEIVLNRILNEDIIYMEGKLRSSNISDGIADLVRALAYNIKAKNNDVDSLLAYLDNRAYFSMEMGHKAGSYNLKTTYHDSTPNPKPYWAATDDDSINAFISNQNINYQVKIADHLMFSTFMDFSSVAKWITIDHASKFFSSDSQSFYYNLDTDNQKIYKMVFDTIAEYVTMLSKEEYADFLAKYQEVLPYLKKGVTIKNSSVDATVNKDCYPTRMLTQTTISLDFSINDLFEIIDILIPDKDGRDEIKAIVTVSNMILRNREGKTGHFSIDFDVVLDENFYYDAVSYSLDKVDMDMFLPVTTENEDRQVFFVAKKDAAMPPVEGENGIKVSEGNDDNE